jgi:hypothetical protein
MGAAHEQAGNTDDSQVLGGNRRHLDGGVPGRPGERHLRPRRVDAIILPKGAFRRVPSAERGNFPLEGQEVVIIQAKASRLGMYLMGQAVFSVELVRRFRPASIRSIALCTKDDSELHPLLTPFPEVEVRVMPALPGAPQSGDEES